MHKSHSNNIKMQQKILKMGSINNENERRGTLKKVFPKNYNPLKKSERLNFNTLIEMIPPDRTEEKEMI